MQLEERPHGAAATARPVQGAWTYYSLPKQLCHGAIENRLYAPYRMFMATANAASYRKVMGECSRIAAKPYFEAKSEWDDFHKEFETKPKGIITAVFLPAISRAVRVMAHGDARHRTARLALAAARYRAEKGELPKTLDALVPDYFSLLELCPKLDWLSGSLSVGDMSFRRCGYATAGVTALSKLLLERGRKFCCLYTDSANSTSNTIYQRIGYRAVCDVVDVNIM